MEKPYIKEVKTITILHYNPSYGDTRKCECGHIYYRHFDSYEGMAATGCKYCDCHEFKEQGNK